MYLNHRYGLGYETLCKEVAYSFTWRRFCRIALDGRVPDPSTLMKLTDGAIAKAKQSGMQLRTVYGDRGFGASTGDAALAKHNVGDTVIPRQQRLSCEIRPSSPLR